MSTGFQQCLISVQRIPVVINAIFITFATTPKFFSYNTLRKFVSHSLDGSTHGRLCCKYFVPSLLVPTNYASEIKELKITEP